MDMALYTIYKGAPRHCGRGPNFHVEQNSQDIKIYSVKKR